MDLGIKCRTRFPASEVLSSDYSLLIPISYFRLDISASEIEIPNSTPISDRLRL